MSADNFIAIAREPSGGYWVFNASMTEFIDYGDVTVPVNARFRKYRDDARETAFMMYDELGVVEYGIIEVDKECHVTKKESQRSGA